MSAHAHAEPGFIALEGGDSRVELVPAQGGRIRSLHLFGREWLLAGDAVHGRTRTPVMQGYGWEECAPAAGGGLVPQWVRGVGGVKLPEGGEARRQVPHTTLSTDHEGHKVSTTWVGQLMHWELTRTLLVRPDGAVEARYEATATGRDKLPFLWSAWMLMPLTSRTRLRLPEGVRFRVATAKGAMLREETPGSGGVWPRVVLDDKSYDVGTPWSLPRKVELKGWIDLGAGRSLLQIWDDDARLTISCDGEGVPYLGLMIDRRGSAHSEGFGFRREGTPSLAIVPALGAPETMAQALGDWQSATWLVPGEPRRWTITIRGGSA